MPPNPTPAAAPPHRTSAGLPGAVPASDPGAGDHFLDLLERALAVRQEALFAVERLLAAPHTPDDLTRARLRVEGLAAVSEALVVRFERAAGLERQPAQLP